MIRVLFIFLSLFLFTTCSCDRSVTLVLSEEHEWAKVSGRPLWHTISFTQGDSLGAVYLPVGERRVRLIIPTGATVIFTARPLGTLRALGGALQGDEEGGEVILSSEEGVLCTYLQKVNRDWSGVIESLGYHTIARNVRIAGNVHYPSLIQSIITGRYEEEKIAEADLFFHTIDSIPSGRYYEDGYEGRQFYKGEYQAAVLPSLSCGVHSFINHERLLILNLIISDRSDIPPAYTVSTPDIIFTISQSQYHQMY